MTFDDMPDLNEQIMNRRGADEPVAAEETPPSGAASEEAGQAEEEESGEEEAMEAQSEEQEELMAKAAALQQHLNAMQFKSFYPALICACIKDVADAITLGLAGIILTLPISLFLFYIFNIAQRQWKKVPGKYSGDLTKNFWVKYVGATFIEFIPGFNLIPTYMMRVYTIKEQSDKAVRSIQSDLRSIMSAIR